MIRHLNAWLGRKTSIVVEPPLRHEAILIAILRQTGSLDAQDFEYPRVTVENGMVWVRHGGD